MKPSPARQARLNDALLKAARDCDKAEVVRLIKAGADIAPKNSKDRMTALHMNAIRGDTQICTLIIEEYAETGRDIKKLIAAKNKDGWTALHYAAGNGHTETCALIIEQYIKAGGDVKELIAKKDNDGWTALHHAAFWEHAQTCVLLLEKGADVNTRDNDGNSALMHAKSEGRDERVEFLKLYPIRKMLGNERADMFISVFNECIQ